MADNLGSYLKRKREEKRLTLRQIEEKTGIKNAHLSQLENGRITKPLPDLLHKLAKAYQIPYEILHEMAGYPPVNDRYNSLKHNISHEFTTLTNKEKDKLLEYLRFLRSSNK